VPEEVKADGEQALPPGELAGFSFLQAQPQRGQSRLRQLCPMPFPPQITTPDDTVIFAGKRFSFGGQARLQKYRHKFPAYTPPATI